MAFSGAVKIGDLNDFIAPSQACVVKIGATKVKEPADAEVGSVQLHRAGAKAAALPSTTLLPPAADPVKISLHDCLACSGCVTSAETVLLQQQSVDELEAQLRDPAVAVAVTLAPQSITSLAVCYGLTPRDAAVRLAAALRTLGVAAVFDLSVSREVALLETAAEFVRRYRLSQRGATELASVGYGGAAAGSGATRSSSGDGDGGGLGSGEAAGPLPMLASACPGWVCYAEKTHGTFVLPHISSTKSPQAVAGTLVKRGPWGQALAGGGASSGALLAASSEAGAAGTLASAGPGAGGGGPGSRRLFHCAVMPCYDKKLEASRDDFYLPGSQIPETDCVLATTELLELLQKHGLDLPSVPAPASGAAFDCLLDPGRPLEGGAELRGLAGGSGGYLEFVVRTAARQLFGVEVPPGPLQMTVGRNPDFRECWLEVGGRRVLRFASAYGFRNIQGLMRKIKLGRCEYDYVEIMACPSGCLNGGGQVRPGKGETPQQLIERLEAAYYNAEGGGVQLRWPADSPEVVQVYQRLAGGSGVGTPAALALFHTQYHQREKSVTAALGDW